MENQTANRKPVLFIIAAILLIIPVYIQGVWIIVSSLDTLKTPSEKEAFYLGHFPSFLHGTYRILLVAFLFSSFAFVVSALNLGKLNPGLKKLAYLVIVISFVVGLLSLFQMM